MNYRSGSVFVGGVVALAGALIASNVRSAQDGNKQKATVNTSAPFAEAFSSSDSTIEYRASNPIYAAAAAGTTAGSRPRVATNSPEVIRKLAEAVRDAKDDEQKMAAQRVFDEALGRYFDEDMAQREEELGKIEERLAKLRELLDRRRAKKKEIIELQTKVALNEADGLGFYNTEQGKVFQGGYGRGSFGRTLPPTSYIPAPAKVQPPQVEIAVPAPPEPDER